MTTCLCAALVSYLAEERRELEYNNSVNTSAQARHYLDTHPDFLDAYHHNTVLSNKKKEFEVNTGTSSFRHRGHDSVLENSVKGKGSSYLYNEGDYLVSNQGPNRNPSDAGEQEEMLASDFQGDHVSCCCISNSPVEQAHEVPHYQACFQ
jgi:hypothetical protein